MRKCVGVWGRCGGSVEGDLLGFSMPFFTLLPYLKTLSHTSPHNSHTSRLTPPPLKIKSNYKLSLTKQKLEIFCTSDVCDRYLL